MEYLYEFLYFYGDAPTERRPPKNSPAGGSFDV